MKLLIRSLALLAALLATPSLWAQIMPMPAEGVTLAAGKKLTMWSPGKVMISSSGRASEPIPDMNALLAKPPDGLFRLERNRRYYRDKELSKLQMGTIGKGVLTEVIYKEGREHAEKSKAQAQQGQGSKSALKSLFKGLFK